MSGVNTTMTFLFTDIEGSTRQWEESPSMHERVERHFAALHEAVAGADGTVFATLGDGIAAAFGSADAAVRAALTAQRAMPSIGVKVRMGIHTGEAERVGTDFRGRPVNRAARICAIGHGGQILVSDVTSALVRTGPHRIDQLDLGNHRLRDLTEAERLWQIVDPEQGEQLFPPVRSLDRYSNNLPVQRSQLIGREHEVSKVAQLVCTHRIVTLTGVGGVGKTRLVIQVAADLLSTFSKVWFVELGSVTDPADVAGVIAVTVGAHTMSEPLSAATALLLGSRVLLVVDNCEHVVDSAARAIDSLLVRCPDLHVVTTSREPLDIDGEHVVGVRTLDPSTTATELFVERAEAAGADVLSFSKQLVEHVCHRLDGLPLAIEIAAARAATLGLTTVVDALDDRFSLLSGGRRRAVDRHSTMRSTIDWSYKLLPSDEQRVLQWLSVFSNGFELDAVRFIAAALGIGDTSAPDVVASLVHKSMITTDAHARGVRHRMLETMRAYAMEQLDQSGERLLASAAHADWVATITGLQADDPCTADVEQHAIRLEREVDNWRDAVLFAVRTGSGDLAARLCGPPTAFFLLGRHDLAEFVRPLLELCGDDRRRRRSVLTALVVASAGAIDGDQHLAMADEVQRLDEPDCTGVGGLMRWMALAWRGEFVASIEVCLQVAADPRLPESSRDLLTGIAVLDQFSLTDTTDDPRALIPHAIEIADRSDVAITRVSCLLGAAWGLVDADPDRSLRLVTRALDEIANVPALTRLTLPGSASRVLTRLDPQIAARSLLTQLDASPLRRSFIDFIPVFYAGALLHRVGHPTAGSALAATPTAALAPHLSMMDFVELARQASLTSNTHSLGELETNVRSALGDIIAGNHTGQLEPA